MSDDKDARIAVAENAAGRLISNGDIIRITQKILKAVEISTHDAEGIRDGYLAAPSEGFNHNTVNRSAVVGRIWRKQGRQVLAMHPAISEEVAMDNSDHVSAEILRTELPYMSPLVVYPQPPTFDGYRGRETMQLLGFLPYSYNRQMMLDAQDHQRPQDLYGLFEGCHFHTHDPEGDTFGMCVFFKIGNARPGEQGTGYETATYSIPFSNEGTMRETVEQALSQFKYGELVDASRACQFTRQVLSTIIGSLFYLCSTSIEVEPLPKSRAAAMRGPSMPKPPKILKVGWKMGAALTRYRREMSQIQSRGMGLERGPQHRKGHYKWQPYGPRNTLRKWIRVSPYWTHVEKLMATEGTTTVHKVPI